MKKLTPPFVLFLLCAWASFAQEMQKYTVKVNDFSELRVDNSIDVNYRCNPDSAGLVTFIGTPEQASWLLFNNNGKGRLAVQYDIDYPIGAKLPVLTLYSSEIKSVVNAGDSLVRILDLPRLDHRFKGSLIGNGRLVIPYVEAPEVNVAIHSGNGQIVVSGSTTVALLKIVGAGTIQADALKAETVKASIVGTGNIGCDPILQLTIQGMGSGTVYYRTTPPSIRSRGIGLRKSPL